MCVKIRQRNALDFGKSNGIEDVETLVVGDDEVGVAGKNGIVSKA